jgi:hypothetical protein
VEVGERDTVARLGSIDAGPPAAAPRRGRRAARQSLLAADTGRDERPRRREIRAGAPRRLDGAPAPRSRFAHHCAQRRSRPSTRQRVAVWFSTDDFDAVVGRSRDARAAVVPDVQATERRPPPIVAARPGWLPRLFAQRTDLGGFRYPIPCGTGARPPRLAAVIGPGAPGNGSLARSPAPSCRTRQDGSPCCLAVAAGTPPVLRTILVRLFGGAQPRRGTRDPVGSG